MANKVGTVDFAVNSEWKKYSSCVSKNGMLTFYGRSASFFGISTSYSIKP